jgi:hypothetical protein
MGSGQYRRLVAEVDVCVYVWGFERVMPVVETRRWC